MTKVCLKNNLGTITVILVVTIIFRTDGFTYTKPMFDEIQSCSANAKKDSKSIDETLTKINYPPGFKFYHTIFDIFVNMSGKDFKPRNKCTLISCINQLQLQGFDRSLAYENYTTKVLESINKNIVPLSYSDFLIEYFKHLQFNKDHDYGLMNGNSFCVFQMCINDILNAGYESLSGVVNRNKASTFEFMRKVLSTDYGHFVKKYTVQVTDVTVETPMDINIFCIRIICKEELKYAEYNFSTNSDRIPTVQYFKSELQYMTIHGNLSFVRRYNGYLKDKNENSVISEPPFFCDAVVV